MDLVFFTELVVNIIDWIDLSVEEKVVLEVFNFCRREWPCEVQPYISLLLNVLVFGVVLRFTKTLHEGLESSPLPVCSWNHLIANFAGKPLSRTNTFEVGSRSVIIHIICAFHPFPICT